MMKLKRICMVVLMLNAILSVGICQTRPAKAVNVNTLGILGDGVKDVTDKLQNAINAHSSLYLPKGKYLISKPLNVQNNTNLNASGAVFVNTGNFAGEAFINIANNQNVTIRGISFKNINDQKRYAITVGNLSSNIIIKRLTAINCGLLHTTVNGMNDSQRAAKQSANMHLTVDSCSGTGTFAQTGVHLEYSRGWSIAHSSFNNYASGVYWWGGDANPAKEGALDRPRLVGDGVVSSVVVSNVKAGGIWGSMGSNITVKYCKVSHCGDVGIDFEGCFNVTASNNTISNCKNGCISTFYVNKNVLFTKNTLSQPSEGQPLARIYNRQGVQGNNDVTFSYNSFKAVSGVGVVDQTGPANDIKFINNRLNNVTLNLSYPNNRNVSIENNVFTISQAIKGGANVIKAGDENNSAQLSIQNNTINNSSAANRNAKGINVVRGGSAIRGLIKSNRVSGVTATE